MIGRSIVLGLIIVGLAACAAGIAARRSGRCVAGQWSPPDQLMIGRDGLVHVEAPQMVATKGGLAFFGDNALVLNVTDSGFGRIAGWPRGPGMLAGVIRKPDGHFEPIALPHDLRSFIAVRAIGDGSGHAHVFWGESSDTTSGQSEHVQGLMYAQFDGTRWSTPERVLADTTMTWMLALTAIAAASGDVHIVVPTRHHPDDATIHVRRRASGEWIIQRLPLKAMYATLAASPDGTLWLGYIRSGSPTDRAAVSIVRSTDGGTTWMSPRDIRRTGHGDAYAVRIVPTAGALYAVWESSPPIAPPAGPMLVVPHDRHDSLQAAVSRDAGLTWTTLRGLSVPTGVGGLEAALGEDGAVHVVFQTMNDSTPVIVTAALRDSQWTELVTLVPSPFWPTMAAPGGDSLLVSWDDWRTAGPERVPFTHVMTWRCAAAAPARARSPRAS
jgi:hypothetical protein